MGAPIPECVLHDPLDPLLEEAGWHLVHRGKVRHTFFNLKFPGKLLSLATNRVSVFDFPLPATVPLKGAVLTAVSVFWFDFFDSVANHMVAYGAGIDRYLPGKLRGNKDLQSRTLIIRHLEMQEMELPDGRMTGVEAIVRGYLTGNGWASYQESGQICGHKLPPGMREWDKLEPPLFTPTTKEEVGHDANVDYKYVDEKCGDGSHRLAIRIFSEAAKYARARGLELIDTKFEFGLHSHSSHRQLMLADEVLTPDSSRFVAVEEFEKKTAKGQTPATLDKQFVRNYVMSLQTGFVGKDGEPLRFKNLQTDNPAHVKWVHELFIPAEIVDRTTEIYREIPHILIGWMLEKFQHIVMGITA